MCYLFKTLYHVVICRVLRKLKPTKRPFIITRSSFIGQGVYSGHWTGDNFATWNDMKFSIAGKVQD